MTEACVTGSSHFWQRSDQSQAAVDVHCLNHNKEKRNETETPKSGHLIFCYEEVCNRSSWTAGERLGSFHRWTMDHILESEMLVVALQTPGGLSFGDFRRLFQSTHGYPLVLSRYGYSSLQRLFDDMRDQLVVVEEADQEPLIKCKCLARHRYLFLGEKELSSEEGLKSAVVLGPPSPSNHSLPGFQMAQGLLINTLSAFATGLKLRKLKEVVKKEHGTDLEELSRDLGCTDVLDLLQQLPGIRVLNPSKPNNCVVQLQGGLQKVPGSLSSSQCSLASSTQAATVKALEAEDLDTDMDQKMEDMSDEAMLNNMQQQQSNTHPLGPAKPNHCISKIQEGPQKVLELLVHTLSAFATGLKLRKLKEVLKKEHGTDLDQLSQDMGYSDTLDLLQHLPDIQVLNPSKPNNCVVQLQGGLREFPVLPSSFQSSLPSEFEKSTSKVLLTEDQDTDLEKQSQDSSDEARSDYPLLQSSQIRSVEPTNPINCVAYLQEGIMKALNILTNTLSAFATGLRLHKLKEVLRKDHGTDLEELSRDLGCTDALDLLQQLPDIKVLNPARPSKCVVQLQGGLLSSSQSSLASGFETPKSTVVLTENEDSDVEDLCQDSCNMAVSGDLPQQNIPILRPAQINNCVAHLQEDFKATDGWKIVNHRNPELSPSRSQSVSGKPKCFSPTSYPILRSSSASPGRIPPQIRVHIKNTARQTSTQSKRNCSPSVDQVKTMVKKELSQKNTRPAQAPTKGINKYLQKPCLKKTNATQSRKPSVLTPPNITHHQQSTPQVSRLRTSTLSYSSIVSGSIQGAPTDKPSSKDSAMPPSTDIQCTNMPLHTSSTNLTGTQFSLPISDVPQRSSISQNVPRSGNQASGDHPLTSPGMPKSEDVLRKNILCVLEGQPNGMSLFQFQITYRTMFNHMLPLNGFTSPKQLLDAMKDVVKVVDAGIQHWVYPILSAARSTQVVHEESGFQKQPGNEESRPTSPLTKQSSYLMARNSVTEDLHQQAPSQALRHKESGGCNAHVFPRTHQDTSRQMVFPTISEPSTQMPIPEFSPADFPPLKPTVITNSTGHLRDAKTPNADTNLPEMPISTNVTAPQRGAASYSSMLSGNSQAAPHINLTPKNLPSTSLASIQQRGTSVRARTVSDPLAQLSIPTSDHYHATAGTQGYHNDSKNADVCIGPPHDGPKSIHELKRNILNVLVQHPDGMSTFQFKKTYMFMFQHMLPLNGHCSVKHLLLAMPDVVKTRGLGAQMVLFPHSSEVPCSNVIVEENGFSLLEMETEPYRFREDTTRGNTNESAALPFLLNQSHPAAEQDVIPGVGAISSDNLAVSTPTSYTLDPEAAIFSPTSPVLYPQFPSVEHQGENPCLPQDISGDVHLGPAKSPARAQSQTSISDIPVNMYESVDIPMRPLQLAPASLPIASEFSDNLTSVADFKAHLDAPPDQKVSVSSEQLLCDVSLDWQDTNCSHTPLAALPETLLVSGTDQKIQNTAPQKASRQQSGNTALDSARTKAPVKFVMAWTDSQVAEDCNQEMFTFGSTSDKLVF
ncbi:uncharacterized protein [Ambystoma mexicanum]|uniref:uncharacterized protein n=1 Tax=Ambystoma mexicanum TaxID=8296 RepID=UPI0037E70FBF